MLAKLAFVASAILGITACGGVETSTVKSTNQEAAVRGDEFVGKTFCKFQPVIYGGSPLTCITFLDNGIGKEIVHYEGVPYEYTFAWQYKFDVTNDAAIVSVSCHSRDSYNGYREMSLQNKATELRVNMFWKGAPVAEFEVYKLSNVNGADRPPLKAECNDNE